MLRVLSTAVLPAILLTLGVFNWSTTCCCGNSMILEILHGSCEHHDSGHSGDDPHPCHKGGGGDFLKAADPDAPSDPVSISPPSEPTATACRILPPIAIAWTVPRGAPPDIPLLTQRWLI
jgi:hypothetical protein